MFDPNASGDFQLELPEVASWQELTGQKVDGHEDAHWVRLPNKSLYTGVLWHYTDYAGAIGIIQGRRIRATALPFLNDTREFKQGLDVLESIIFKILESKYFAPAQKRVLERATRLIGEPSVQANVFIACASAVEDSLSQWRAYGASRGVCLGIDIGSCDSIRVDENRDEEIPEAPDFGINGIDWKKVSYGDEQSSELLKEVIGYLCYICPGPDDSEENFESFVTGIAVPELLKSVSLCKDSAFEDEQEVRAVVTRRSDSKLLFRPGSYGPTPFMEIGFRNSNRAPFTEIKLPLTIKEPDNLPVTSAWAGPGPHAETTATGLKILLMEEGIKPSNGVHVSSAPFR